MPDKEKSMWSSRILWSLFAVAAYMAPLVDAYASNGERLYSSRCAMCHGADAKASGPLARKSNPPTPDLTTAAFKKRLEEYPGVIVSSIILRPNGDLIPKTLRDNGYRLPSHAWSVQDFRDLNDYMKSLIYRSK